MKKRLFPILMAIMMVFAMMPMTAGAVFADDDPVYTVTVEPGEGTGTAFTVQSTTILSAEEARSGNYDQTKGCFYRDHFDESVIVYKFPSTCTFAAPEGMEFDCWECNGVRINDGLEMNIEWMCGNNGNTTAQITALWKEPEAHSSVDFTIPTNVNVRYGDTQTAFDIQVTSATFQHGAQRLDVSFWNASFSSAGGDATIPFSVTTNGQGPGSFQNGCAFYVYPDTTLPYSCQVFINISSDAWAAAEPGTYSATLIYTDDFDDATGEGTIALSLTVPDGEPPVETFTVTFVDGQGNILKTETVESGQAATAPAAPTRDGFTFDGWDTDFDNVTSDLTVTAQWKENTTPPEPTKIAVPTGKTLTYNGKSQTGVAAGTGYTLSGTTSATNAGSYKATATLKEGYAWSDDSSDSKTINWKINAKAITPAVTLSAAAFTYNGKVQKPTVMVKDGSTKLAASQYDVTYASGRKNVGTYKVTVKMKGNYSGSKTVSFKINPKATTMSTVTAASKGFTAKWKKLTTQTTGYQLQYALNSKFTSGKKTVTISSNKTVSKKVTKLKASKKYYVRVRTYKTVSGKKYYSAWSKAKAVTTKK